ncbi:hypothetical protein GTV15_09790, partial [Streptomyces sp. SID7803]|nr:hypothetical protein [Streptomyces sp. SID7803]
MMCALRGGAHPTFPAPPGGCCPRIGAMSDPECRVGPRGLRRGGAALTLVFAG